MSEDLMLGKNMYSKQVEYNYKKLGPQNKTYTTGKPYLGEMLETGKLNISGLQISDTGVELC